MTRHLFTFLGTFVFGALLALLARAAWHDPNAGHTGGATPAADAAPMVSNTMPAATPATAADHAVHGATAATSTAANDHSAHADSTPEAAPNPGTVNTVCAICGMEVDPDLPTAEYQGKKIGFGCKSCPAIFKANPDKYGPAYLRNEVVED